ncbi:hypothetical protein, partial [Nonomuraea sp. SBT364]|uniref:hypothetical protein n=1 Tax=Nonomuraea sp. SBT364 TaxID=1580530 RepID=UPI003FA56A5A
MSLRLLRSGADGALVGRICPGRYGVTRTELRPGRSCGLGRFRTTARPSGFPGRAATPARNPGPGIRTAGRTRLIALSRTAGRIGLFVRSASRTGPVAGTRTGRSGRSGGAGSAVAS